MSQGRGYGDICIHIADSLCYTAEHNTVKQLHSNKDVKKKSQFSLSLKTTLVQNYTFMYYATTFSLLNITFGKTVCIIAT